MLIYFPDPYPNEDFRSIIFRYHHRSGNADMTDTKKELFGIASSKLGHFPRSLSTLLKKLPTEEKNFKEKLLSNTWYHLFKPFLTKERVSTIEQDMLYGKSSHKNYIGKVASQRNTPVLSKTIRYCIKCMQEDYKKFGEIYAHLEHQIDFLDFCPIHLINLSEKCPVCDNTYSDLAVGVLSIKPCCNTSSHRIEESTISRLKLRLYNEMEFFKKYASNMESHILYAKIIALLGNNGYIDLRGYIEKRRVIDDLVKHYQLDVLNLVSVSSSLTKRNLAYFVKEEHMSKFIILYFLLIIFLEGSIESWINKEYYSIPIPFGNGPWACYNPICSSFKMNSIYKCKRTITGKSNIGRFKCDECGFIYTLKECSEENENHCKFQVERRGFLWEKKVLEFYNSGYSVKQIANLTNTPVPSIKHCIKLYESNISENNNQKGITTFKEELYVGFKEVSVSKEIELKKIHRKKIISLLKSQENLKRMDILKIAPTTYIWILKYDRKWFENVLPQLKRPSLDFEVLDLILRIKVRKAAKLLIKSNPPTRIKQYSILNKLTAKDKNRILSHKNKLPLTVEELETHIESLEDYQVRHIPSLVTQLKAGGYVNITLNSILAFRRSYRNCSEETKQRIVKVLEEVQKIK
jgi:hypothetical protein